MNDFKTQLQYFQFLDKYSRWNYDTGRRETWEESIDRAVNYLVELSGNKLPQSDYDDIRNAMIDMAAFCSMRLFAMAGEAARRDNSVLYNCSYREVDSTTALSEILYLSMSGVGVGFSVEKEAINKLPTIRKQTGLAPIEWTIDDSQKGWAYALKVGLRSWFDGTDVVFNYSQVRPAGSVLFTKGGRASGPDPLQRLLDFARDTILNAQGRKLKPLEVHDIVCMIGDCAVSGGSRRSAMISLFDYDDEDMRHAKDYGWWKTHPQRANANNSIIIENDLTRDEIESIMMTMHNGGGGEPGFYLRKNAGRFAPRRSFVTKSGSNPCQPDFATVLTPDGIRTLGEVEVGDIIWSGNEWTKIAHKWSTGIKPVYRFSASYGEFVGTENHTVFQNGKRVAVKDATKIDALPLIVDDSEEVSIIPGVVMDGIVLGDGSVHKASGNFVFLCIGQDDYDYFNSEISDLVVKERGISDYSWEVVTSIEAHELPYTYDRVVPDRYYRGDKNTMASFLRGLFTANGSTIGKRVVLKQSSRKIIKQVQEMLSALGIASYITINKPNTIKWANGDYTSRQSYDLNISSDRYKFLNTIGFVQDYKNKAVCGGYKEKHGGTGVVQSKEYLGDFEVFDITVESKDHSYWTGGLLVSNCGEVDLNSKQFCNLSQAIVRPDDTGESLTEKVRLATIIGTIQSTATDFAFLSSEWKEITERDRLLGVDLTGQLDHPDLITPSLLDSLRETVIETNREYANILGINQSVATTANKPSGNSSILFDCSPGIHSRWSDYYIRRVRINANSPMRHALEASGFTLLPENGQQYETANTFVIEFPVKAPDGAITNGTRNAIDQCEWWKMNKIHWTEHNPSTTIMYNADELPALIDWIYDNQDIIGGLSFLERDNNYYPLSPYESIDEATYNQMLFDLPQIDFDLLAALENEDFTNAAQEVGCANGLCLI